MTKKTWFTVSLLIYSSIKAHKLNKEVEMNANATKLLNAIEEFRKFDADIQSQTIAVFLYVGLHAKSEGVPMTVIAEKLAMAQSSVSRNVSLLSKYSWRQKEGLNFLVAEEDPFERRRKLVKLTNRGKRLYETISQ